MAPPHVALGDRVVVHNGARDRIVRRHVGFQALAHIGVTIRIQFVQQHRQ